MKGVPFVNWPLPSSKDHHFQNEAKCTTFLVKMSFICTRMKIYFHIKGWALNLVLIQRPGVTQKWHIGKGVSESVIWDCNHMKRPNDANRDILWARIAKKPWPQPGLVICSYLKYDTFTALKEMQRSEKISERVLNRRYMKEGPFLSTDMWRC